MPLNEPIVMSAILDGTKSDRDGEWKLTLAIPASDAAKAARLSLLKGIVFQVTFVPEAAGTTEPTL